MISQRLTFWQELKLRLHQTAVAMSNHGTDICTNLIESKRVDLYEVRKAHLRYMSKSGRVIGLQEVRNLADLLCKVLRDNGVH